MRQAPSVSPRGDHTMPFKTRAEDKPHCPVRPGSAMVSVGVPATKHDEGPQGLDTPALGKEE